MIALGLFIVVAVFVSYRAGVAHERRRAGTLKLPPLKTRGDA